MHRTHNKKLKTACLAPILFESPAAFREWLEKHHADATELLVGFYKRGTGRPSMTWPESVDQALCFGWIDGVRKRVDDERYTIRFTPRRPGSIWSAVNIRRATELQERGLMAPAGVKAFEKRRDDRSRVYSFENPAAFTPEFEKRFRANRKAWKYFEQQPPWYRRVAAHLVMSAKKEETRERRFLQLIEDSARERRLKQVDQYGRGTAARKGR